MIKKLQEINTSIYVIIHAKVCGHITADSRSFNFRFCFI